MPPLGHLGAVFKRPGRRQRQQILDSYAFHALTGRKDHANFRVVVEEYLPVAATRPDRSSPVISYGNDVRHACCAACACCAQSDQLGAGTACKVIEVYPDKSPSIVGADRCTHCVDTVFIRTSIGR